MDNKVKIFLSYMNLFVKEGNDIKFISFFLLIHISIKFSSFGNNVFNIFSKRGIFILINRVETSNVNTSKLQVLTQDETKELFRKMKEGDKEAREKLINGNLRLVLSLIQRFCGRGENADDLFQVGCVGLIKAIDNFDTSLDIQLSTYGVPMIMC